MSLARPISPLAIPLLLFWITASPGTSLADGRCSISPRNPTIAPGDSIRWQYRSEDLERLREREWEFAGGSPSSSQESTPSVRYQSAGTFKTKLHLSGRERSAECETRVTVTQVQPQSCNLSASPTSLAFGNVQTGDTKTLGTTLTNNGGATCSLTLQYSGGTEFTIPETTTLTVAPGGSQTLSVSYTPNGIGTDSDTLVISSNDPGSPMSQPLSGAGVDTTAGGCGAGAATSINSTSQNGCPDVKVDEQPQVANSSYSILAINDLGMHCGDLDTRIASILPPFQLLLAQVIQKGGTPTLNPAGVQVYYSAASNPNDPISDQFDALMGSGDTYKTNFWDFPVPAGTYDPFYPAYDPFNPATTLTPLAGPPFNVSADVGLPVPNVEDLYIGPDGQVQNGDESLTAVMHAMPGMSNPYLANVPQLAQEHYLDKPFFIDFPFGYVAANVNWYEAAGIPFAAFDDSGRENPYPLVRVEARSGGNTVSTVDTVLPISGEASCMNCHTTENDYTSIFGNATDHRTNGPTDVLSTNGLPVATSVDDPSVGDLPPRVSLEYAADINVLRLHDFRHGARYVSTACDAPGQNCLQTAAAPCDIQANDGIGDTNCLTNQALPAADGGQGKPVVCQVCHYTPALDLAHLGPQAGPPGTIANGRNQVAHQSNSRVMHNHHGSLPGNLFPAIPAPIQGGNGVITNQGERLTALDNSCYQCHPGKNVKCLRGAMFNGGMLCSDCHGSMSQVGDDFSRDVSPSNPGAFHLAKDFYTNPLTPRVPWANEPGCGSCHTGDANDNLSGLSGALVNAMDTFGNSDGIRLRQAFVTGDARATPIVPTNKRFAEPLVPASFNGFANPGAGNPQLYRVSTGHGGVMCEGCHGATHAEWPNANPNANDNLTAKQLQGHTGTISDCGTCHTTSELPSNTQGGPHGMHLVNDSRFWREAHKDAAERENRQPGGGTCGACHGSDHLGTVLSRTPVARTWTVEGRTRTVAAGDPVACNVCHSLNESFERD